MRAADISLEIIQVINIVGARIVGLRREGL